MQVVLQSGGARALLQTRLPDQTVGLAWLGQAGFMLCHAGRRWLIDPYLSDHLARKYAGTEFPHERMMPPPVSAEEIRALDLVLCSHRHSDHMDPGSLSVLAANNSSCRFVVPRAELDTIATLGLPGAQTLPVNDRDIVHLGDSIEVNVLPSAHETLKVNDRGEHHFLGFVLKLGGLTLYHSGDCVVYDGLVERLCQWRVDLALLPVNGRCATLSARGIMGNMNFDEARNLCLAAGIGVMIPHHFGMFAFNTVDPVELEQKIARVDARLKCLMPSLDRYFLIAAAAPCAL